MSDVTATDEAAGFAEAAPDQPAAREGGAWAAIVSLALGVFGLVTAEFLPASLLTPIARDLGISDGTAGQAVTATAVIGAIAGPAIVIGTGRIDRRLVVLGLTLLLIASNLVAAAADSLALLLAARMALGVALGGFWSLAAALALRLVPIERMPRAMAIIFTGVSVATVCAAPVGAFLGDLWGWRVTFVLAALVGVVAFAAQLVTIPRLPPVVAPSLGSLVAVLRRPSLRLGYLVVLLVVSGHFAGFTYIRPFLEEVPRLSIEAITGVLLAFGIGGFFGNLAGAFIAERSPRAAVSFGALLLGVTAVALLAWGSSAGIATAATAAWGFAFGALPVGIQTWTTRAAQDQAESAGALLLTAFQVAIASGAVLGGLLVDGFGASGAIAYCGVAVIAGGVMMALVGRGRAA